MRTSNVFTHHSSHITHHSSRFTLYASLFTLLFLSGLAPNLQAATGTNKQFAGSTEYWTNNAFWTGLTYPGSAAGETACLATNMTGSYTNILDATLLNTTLVALSISNVNGTATLIATNTTFTSTTLNLGTGGRLQLDNLATQTLATLNLNGLDPTITINDGATLSMGGAAANINLFNGLSGTTAQVVRATSGGAGSLWDVSGRQLFIGRSNSAFNVMTINGGGAVGGLVVANVGNAGGSVGALNIGDVNVVSNRLNLINGVRLTSPGALRIGNTVTSRYNVVTVDDSTLILGEHVSVGLTSTNSGNSLVVTNGGLVSAVGMYVGNSTTPDKGSSNNMVTVVGTNSSGSRSTINLNAAILSLSQADKASSNRVVVDYGMITNISYVRVANVLSGGSANAANDNMLAVTNGGFLSTTGLVQIGGIGATGNVLRIDGGLVSVGGDVQIGGTTTTGNTMRINGGAMTNLSLTVKTNNSVVFSAGTLAMGSATYDDGPVFNVGDGTQTATLIALDSLGTLNFYGGMRINSNATLSGVGTIKNRAVGSAALTITNGAILDPGLTGPVLFTVSTNMVWSGGGEFQCDITDVAGGIGVGWDSLSMAGSLTVADAGVANPLRISLNSLGADTANFDPAQNYSLKIAACGSVVGYTSTNDFQISTNNFLPVSAGTWTVAYFENGLYLVYTASGSAQPTADYSWIVPTSGYWDAANWVGGIPTANGDTAWTLTFGGDSTRYGSTNNLAGTFQLSNMVFNSATPSVTNLIAGNTIEFGGAGGGIQQWGSGSFQVSNSINLAADLTFSGPGLGTVFLHTNITGVGFGLTKLDAGKLVLQGSNTFNGPVLVNGNGMLRADHRKALGRGSVTVSNGTLLVNAAGTALELGQPGYNGLTGLVTGSGSLWTNNAIFTVGSTSSFNTLTIANTGRLFNAAAASYVGNNGPSNTAIVKDGGIWSLGATTLTVGQGLATGNVLRVEGSGSVMTNAPLTIGGSGGQFNSLAVTNNGRVYGSTAASSIGSSASNNTALVSGGGLWNLGGQPLNVGSGGATGNVLRVDEGGVVTNTGLFYVGNAGGQLNTLMITNGGRMLSIADSYFGYGSSNCFAIIEGSNSAGSAATLSIKVGSALWVGNGAGGAANTKYNWMRVGAGGLVEALGFGLRVGYSGGEGNYVIITNGGIVKTGLGWADGIGYASSNNYLIVSGVNGPQPSSLNGGASALEVGTGAPGVSGGSGNWMRVESGGLATNHSTVTVGATAKSQFNSLTITNGGLFYSTGAGAIGVASASNNSIVVAGADGGGQKALWYAAGQNITIGSGTGTGNVLRIGDGGVLSNAVLLFNTPTPKNSVVVESGGAAYAGLILGSAASFVTNPAITVSGVSLWDPGSDWNGGSNVMTVGSAAGANSNYATINNRIFTNFGTLTLGGAWNTLLVTNGGQLHSAGAVSLAPNDSADFNQLIVAGGAGVTSVWNAGNAAVNASMGTAANNDALVVDGRGALGSAVATNLVSLNIGYQFLGTPYGVSNSVTVTNGGLLYVGSSGITGGSYSRLEVVQGGQLNTVGGITVATLSGRYSEMIVRDSGSLLKGQNITITVGINGANSNRLEISNYGVVSNASVIVGCTAGNGGNMLNNVMTITGGGRLYGYSGGASYIGFSEFMGSRSAYWSTGIVSGSESLWDLKTGTLTVGSGGFSNGLVVSDGATVTNCGTLGVGIGAYVGSSTYVPGSDNRVFIKNGGRLFCTAANIGSGCTAGYSANSNRVDVTGASSLWDLGGGALTFGATSVYSNNVLTIDQGGTVDNIGTLTVTTNNNLLLPGGTLGVSNGTFNTGRRFDVGDGTQSAMLKVMGGGGTLGFSSGLLVSSNATLQGIGLVRGGVPGIVVTNGGRFSPGVNNPGLLTVSNLTWHGGATFQCEITNFGMAGVGYDQLAISNATLTLMGGSSNLIIRLDSLGTAAANFSSNADYNLCVVNAGTISGFNASNFNVDVSDFSNPYSGTWGVMTNGGNLYVTYRANVFAGLDYTWAAPSNGNWDVNGNWTNPVAPAPNSPGTSLRFGGDVAGPAYSATNNNTPGAFQVNKLVLTNNNPIVTNRLAGNPLEFGYAGAGIEQWGVGGFGIGNRLDLTTNFTFGGTGSGVVLVGSNITGVGSMTKQGPYTVVLQLSNSFAGPVVVDGAGGTLQFNGVAGLGRQNAVTVSNGTLLANLALAWSNRNALVTGSGSLWTNSGGLTIGTNAQMTVDNSGQLKVVGALTVGDSGTVTNSLTVANGGSVFSTLISYIGNATSNNSVLVTGSGSKWFGLGGLTIGSGAVTGNVLMLNGGAVSNAAMTVGSAGSGYNSLTVTNGGSVYSTALSYIGNATSNNSVLVTGSGSQWAGTGGLTIGGGTATGNVLTVNGGLVSDAAITVGSAAGSGDNILVVTNGGQLRSSGGVILGGPGAGSFRNRLIVAGGAGVTSLWDNGNTSITLGRSLGSNTSTNNTLIIDGKGELGSAVVTNINQLTIGYANNSSAMSANNSVIVTNGGVLYLGAGLDYGNGAAHGIGVSVVNANNSLSNSLVIAAGGRVYASGALIVGYVSYSGSLSGNRLEVRDAGLLDMRGNGIYAPLSAAAGTPLKGEVVVLIDGGTVTNASFIVMPYRTQGAAVSDNRLTVTNSGKLYTTAGCSIGNMIGTNSVAAIGGAGSLWDMQGQNLTVGNTTCTNNGVTIDGGGALANVGTLVVYTNNFVTLRGGTLSVANVTWYYNALFNVGDGAQAATLNALGGGLTFENGLRVNNRATLAGVGTVAGGMPGVVLTNGSILSAGLDGIGTLTLSNTTWYGGATNIVEITDVSGFPGVGYDTVIINTQLTLAANGGLNFVVKMDSKGGNANFQTGQDYWIKIMTCSTSATPLASSLPNFRVDTSAFDPANKNWWVTNVGYTLYLTTTGAVPVTSSYVWNPANSGKWSEGANWEGTVAPDPGDSSYVLEFGGSGTQTYTATNNLGENYPLNLMRLTSTSSKSNFLGGQSLLFSGTEPGISLEGNGWTVSTNKIYWTGSLSLAGSGQGGMILASNLVGTGAVTVASGGTYVMAVSNAFLGDLLVNCSGLGKLRVDHANALGSNSVTVSNGTLQITPAITLGGPGQANLQGLVTGSGSIWTNVGVLKVGSGSGRFNTLTIANAGRMTHAGAVYIGDDASNNTAIVKDGGIWDLKGIASLVLRVGSGSATGNVLRFEGTGAVITNSSIRIGDNGGQLNRLLLTNNASIYGANAFSYIGYRSSNNTAVVSGGGLWNLAGQQLIVGSGSANVGNDNVLTVGDGGFVTNTAQLTIGTLQGARLNGLVITNGGRVHGGTITFVGYDSASNNYMIVEGSNSVGPATFSAAAADARCYVGHTGGWGNWMRVGSGGLVSLVTGPAGGIVVGYQSLGGNYMIITNGGKVMTSINTTVSKIGHLSSNNYAIVKGSNVNQASTWDNGTAAFDIGNLGTGNWMRVEAGGLVTNVGMMTVGTGAGSSGNSLTLTNGGRAYVTGLTLAAAASNRLNGVGVYDGGLLDGKNYTISIGIATVATGTGSNSLTVGVGGTVTNAGTLQVGNTSSSNQLYLSGGSLSVSNLVCSNVNNTITFSAGTLNLRGAFISNTVPFVVGDGAQGATLSLVPGRGTNIFAQGLTITNKATLTGAGMIWVNALTTNTVYGTNSPGVAGVGVITNIGNVTLATSAVTRIELTANTTGGNGWDLLVVTNGTLTVGGTLKPILTSGFTPTEFMSFVIMTNFAASVGGSFANEASGKVNVYTNDSLTSLVGAFNVGVSNSQYVVLNNFKPPLASGTVFRLR